jgi:hypothetical protein
MVTFEEARALAQTEIDRMSGEANLDLILIDEPTMTEPYGWVFFYDDRRHFETGDDKYLIAGNAPLLVLRDTGEVRLLGTARPTQFYLAPYRGAHLAGSPVSDVQTPR